MVVKGQLSLSLRRELGETICGLFRRIRSYTEVQSSLGNSGIFPRLALFDKAGTIDLVRMCRCCLKMLTFHLFQATANW